MVFAWKKLGKFSRTTRILILQKLFCLRCLILNKPWHDIKIILMSYLKVTKKNGRLPGLHWTTCFTSRMVAARQVDTCTIFCIKCDLLAVSWRGPLVVQVFRSIPTNISLRLKFRQKNETLTLLKCREVLARKSFIYNIMFFNFFAKSVEQYLIMQILIYIWIILSAARI